MVNPVGKAEKRIAVIDGTIQVYKTRITAADEVRRAPPVGIEEIPIVDVAIRAHINHIVIADEVRRAKPPKLFGQKLVYFRRNCRNSKVR